MIITIEGEKYIFEIISQRQGRCFCFFIRAKNKDNYRTSCINNLNPILSEFNIDKDDPKVMDSTWVVTKEEAQYLTNIAKQFLSDKSYLNYIEGKLDEDRMLGEWENVL